MDVQPGNAIYNIDKHEIGFVLAVLHDTCAYRAPDGTERRAPWDVITSFCCEPAPEQYANGKVREDLARVDPFDRVANQLILLQELITSTLEEHAPEENHAPIIESIGDCITGLHTLSMNQRPRWLHDQMKEHHHSVEANSQS